MIRVPSLLQEDGQFQTLSVGELTFIAYRQRRQGLQSEVFFEQHGIIFVLDGKKMFRSGDQEFVVTSGEALFVQKGCYYLSEVLPDVHDYQSILFFLSDRLIRTFIDQNPEVITTNDAASAPLEPVFKLTLTPDLVQFFPTVQSLLTNRTPYLNRLLWVKFTELLLYLLAGAEGRYVQSLFRNLYDNQKADLTLIMHSYFLKPLTLDEYASLSGRSLSVFKRDFQQEFGISPGVWIRQKRMEHAHFLLQHSGQNVAEVCMAVGYESVSHFIKVFRETYGFTPNQY